MKTVQAFKDVTTKVNPTIGFQTIQFNVKTFADPRLRAGLAHAINRKQIVDELLLGNGEVIDGPYTSQSPFLDKSLKTLSYDPELAKKAGAPTQQQQVNMEEQQRRQNNR